MIPTPPLPPPALHAHAGAPAWLQARARSLARPEAARLQAELYGCDGDWVLRLIQLPEEGDVTTWAERWFAFRSPEGKTRTLSLDVVSAEPTSAMVEGATYPLAGRWVMAAH